MSISDDKQIGLPQKRYYRQRAHSNPLSDHTFDYPTKTTDINWLDHYPTYKPDNPIRHADIGCGYGGLLITLSEMFEDKLSIGMEIRVKVSDYVMDRINALRKQHNNEKYMNIACLRTNAMKYLPNFFEKGQLDSMFFLYPDPHFKKAKYKWRIVNYQLLAEYAYVVKIGVCLHLVVYIRPFNKHLRLAFRLTVSLENYFIYKGFVYTMTDVEDLSKWMVSHFEDFPLFERVNENELKNDEIATKLRDCSEEGKKVVRNKGDHFLAVFRRIEDPFKRT